MNDVESCWLCHRPLGEKVEMHHMPPKSMGGKEKVPLHPICHRMIHTLFSETQLARTFTRREDLLTHPDMAKFLKWIADKPADFYKPSHKKFH